MPEVFLDWIVREIKSNNKDWCKICTLIHGEPVETKKWISRSLPGWSQAAAFEKNHIMNFLATADEVLEHLQKNLPRYPTLL